MVGILIHRLIGEQIDTSAAPVPNRVAIRAHVIQVVERCRVIPGAQNDLPRVEPATTPADAELTRA